MSDVIAKARVVLAEAAIDVAWHFDVTDREVYIRTRAIADVHDARDGHAIVLAVNALPALLSLVARLDKMHTCPVCDSYRQLDPHDEECELLLAIAALRAALDGDSTREGAGRG